MVGVLKGGVEDAVGGSLRDEGGGVGDVADAEGEEEGSDESEVEGLEVTEIEVKNIADDEDMMDTLAENEGETEGGKEGDVTSAPATDDDDNMQKELELSGTDPQAQADAAVSAKVPKQITRNVNQGKTVDATLAKDTELDQFQELEITETVSNFPS